MIVTVQGEELLIWPFLPQENIIETLEWLTDVMPSYASEQRASLRTKPRSSIQYNYLLNAQQYSRAKAFIKHWGADVFGCPVWFEASIAGALTTGATEILFDTAYADYRDGGLALVWDNDTLLEVVEITTVLSDRLTLTGTLANTYTRAWVMPIRRSKMTGTSVGAQRASGQYSSVSAQFYILDTIDLSAGATPFTIHAGYQVMEDRPDVVDSIEESVIFPQSIFDNNTGTIYADKSRAFSELSQMASWQTKCGENLWNTRLWLHSMRGRSQSFWMPSYNNDLQIAADIGASDTTIEVTNIGFVTYYTTADIMILLKDGARYYRTVTGSIDNGATETLSISSLGTAVTQSEIDIISIMTYSRFDTGRFELNHRSKTNIALRAPIKEIQA